MAEVNKILVADDEERMRKLVSDFLKKAGYSVIEAKDGKEALNAFNDIQDINMFILDIMMPEYDGWTVCRKIRQSSDVPIIILTARGEEEDQLFGYELGADEYVAKPFSPNILVARVNAIFKRIQGGDKKLVEIDGIVLDFSAHTVTINDKRIDLSPKEYELMAYLAENQGIAFTRDQILNAVWNYDYFGDARTVDTHIKKLRTKLEDKGDYIETVRGHGYRFGVKR